MRRFYTDENLIVGHSVLLNENEAKHMRNVLRLDTGDEILLFNGEVVVKAKIERLSSERSTAVVLQVVKEKELSERNVTLAFCLLKQMSLNELVVQKAVELGVDTFIPIESEFSQLDVGLVWNAKLGRTAKIVLEASKQSERDNLMDLGENFSFKNFINSDFKGEKLMFTLKRQTDQSVIDFKDLNLDLNKNICVLIGPEGGFSRREHEMAVDAGWQLVSLGDFILRAETAAILAAGVVRVG